MNLFQEAGSYLRWLASVAGVFFRLRPFTTTVLIGASIGSRVTGLMAFLLPLKVIHVVTSGGVSGSLEALIPGAGKDAWVMILFGAAVAAFVISLLLDALMERLTASTSVTVLQKSNRLAVFGKQDSHARGAYAEFAEVTAGAVFVLLGYAAIGFLAPMVIAALVALLAMEFLFSAGVLQRMEPVNARGLARFIVNDLNDYLNVLSTLNFLIAFAVLLYPFLAGSGGNVTAAVASIIILRRISGILTGTVRKSVNLAQRRPIINALIFRDLQFEPQETNHVRTLRETFNKESRLARTAEALRAAGVEPGELNVHWQDSTLSGVTILAVRSTDAHGEKTNYQQQIYPRRQDHRLKNEEVLFTYVARRALSAPRLVLRFSEGPFDCQLCEAGTGAPITQKAWPRTQHALIEQLIGYEPPSGLVRDFSVSHPMLHDRLSDTFLKRSEMAVDTDDEQQTFDETLRVFPDVRSVLAAMPLWIYNPEVKRGNVLQSNDGGALVMAWGKWALEPVGAALPEALKWAHLEELAARIKENRADAPAQLGPAHLQLAAECWIVEQCIKAARYKAALRCMRRILANRLVQDDAVGSRVAAGSDAPEKKPELEARH